MFDSTDVLQPSSQYSPETVPMVELAVDEEPLHQVNVFLASSTSAAQAAALGRCSHLCTGLRRQDPTTPQTQDVVCRMGGTRRRHQGKGQDVEQ